MIGIFAPIVLFLLALIAANLANSLATVAIVIAIYAGSVVIATAIYQTLGVKK